MSYMQGDDSATMKKLAWVIGGFLVFTLVLIVGVNIAV